MRIILAFMVDILFLFHGDCSMYYFIIDNGLYGLLVRTDKEARWDVFYDSLMVQSPEYDNEPFKVIFTGLSLLEAIGWGSKLKKSSKDQFVSPALDNKDKIMMAPKTIYDAAFLFYKRRSMLQRKNLLKRINKQIRRYSASKATVDLVQETLGYWKECLKKRKARDILKIIHELAWDATCSFEYVKQDNVPLIERKNVDANIELLYNALFFLWYDLQYNVLRKKRIELTSYRITDRASFAETHSLSYREIVLKEQSLNHINSIKIKAELDLVQDLSDTDLIHYVTLGHYNFEHCLYTPVVAFTCDNEEQIRDRICLQILHIKKLQSIKPDLQIIPGVVYFVNRECGVIGKPLYVRDVIDGHQRISGTVKGKKSLNSL